MMRKTCLAMILLILVPLVLATGTDHLELTVPGTAMAGTAISVTVTAKNPDDTVKTGYTGTVSFTSSDTQALLPSAYLFTTGEGGDNGTHTFSVTLRTAGSQTITVTDGSMTSMSSPVIVSATTASTITATASPGSISPGGTSTITATLKDAYNNPVPSISVNFSVTGGNGSVSPTPVLTNSSGQAMTTFTAGTAAGTSTIGASVTSPALSSSTSAIVTSAAPSAMTVTASPVGVPAGGTSTITATLKDMYNNPVPSVTINFSVIAGGGSIAPSSASTNASGQATTTLTTNTIPGTNTVSASVTSPVLSGTVSIIGQDTTAPAINHIPVTSGVVSSPVTITATVTDNVGVSSVSLFYRKTGTSIYTQLSMTPTATPNVYQGTIPGSSVTASGVDYYIKAEDAVPNTNFHGTSASPHVIAVSSVDIIPPVITHTPITSAVANNPVTVGATVIDNVGIASATLFYRKTGTSVYTPVAMTGTGSVYSATIPASSVTTAGVDYYIEAKDAVPNTTNDGTSIAPHVITISAIDTIPPVITHTPATSAVANNAVTISATVTDNVAVASVKLYYRKTGPTAYTNVAMTGTGSVYSATIPASSVTTAGVDYYIEAKDAVPNTTNDGTSIAPHVIAVSATDTVLPVVIHTPVTAGYSSTDIIISATITDNVAVASASLYYRTSGTTTYTQKTMTGTGSVYSATIPASSVTTAGVDYYIEAKDAVPNTMTHGSSSSPHQILITGIPVVGSPPVSLSPASLTTISTATPTFSWSAVTGAISYTVEYASTPIQVTVTTTSYTVPTPLQVGSHYWKVRTNYSGGSSAWSSQQNFTITIAPTPQPTYPPIPWPPFPPITPTPTDKIAPTSQITSPPNGAKMGGTMLLIKGTATDNTEVKKVEVSTDAGLTWQLATGTSSWSYSWRLPTDGIYVIKSRATDRNTNVEMLGPSVTVTIDNSSPSTTIAVTEGLFVSGTTFKISGTASDMSGIKSVEVSTDGVTWNLASGTTEWSYQWNVGPDGRYTIKVRAADTLGNADVSSSATILVDNRLPRISIAVGQGQRLEKSNKIVITGTSEDENGIAKVEISTDGGQTWVATEGTAAWKFEWLYPPAGTFLIKARATDAAGNMNEAEPRTITIAEKEKTFTEKLLANWKLLALIAGGLILGITVVLLIFYFRSR